MQYSLCLTGVMRQGQGVCYSITAGWAWPALQALRHAAAARPFPTTPCGGSMTGPQLLEDWQVQHVTRLLRDILKRAHGADERYPFPPLAVMVTTYGPTESPRGDVAYEGAIRVRVTLPDGQSTAL